MESAEIQISYTFRFEDSTQKSFKVRIDNESLNIIRSGALELPDWARMQNFKCQHCPLDAARHEYCPVAVNLVDIIEEFKEFPSYEKAEVTIETQNRNFSRFTSLQSGVSALVGIKMVTSGCPVMGRLKPMLHTHLPFATLEETQIRAFSLYLLSQYIAWRKGGKPDWEMNRLANFYEDIRILNYNVSKQIADLEKKDTSINSLIILNNFADYVTFTLDEKLVDELEYYFRDFIAE